MTKGVKYISMAETSGYGLSALAYIGALVDAGVTVTWHPRVRIQGRYRPATTLREVQAALGAAAGHEAALARFHAPGDYDTVIVHMTPEHWPDAREPGRRMVGYTVWETDRLPLHWPPLLEGYDLILTPSSFSRDLFTPHTSAAVQVLPHLPRRAWPRAEAPARAAFRRRFGAGDNTFLVYSINTWILRKALWLTLQAYLLGFSENDDTLLLLKSNPHGEGVNQRWGPARQLFDRILSNYPDAPRVVLVTEELDDDDIGMLHLAGDAYLSLAHSEGFGLGAFDAASAGTPVVTTGWSGPLDFLPPEHACLVDYELRRVRQHLGNHAPQEQYWAHADLEHAIDWLQRLYRDPAAARRRGAGLRAHIAENFDPAAIHARLLEALDG